MLMLLAYTVLACHPSAGLALCCTSDRKLLLADPARRQSLPATLRGLPANKCGVLTDSAW